MKFELEPYHNNVPDEELLQDLARVAKDIGKEKVTRDEYDDRGKFHGSTLTRRFGSWNEAIKMAGLNISHYMNVGKEECFENLEKVWEKLGRQPSYHDMHEPLSKYSGKPYIRLFGSWRKALEAFVASFENQQDELVEGNPNNSLTGTSEPIKTNSHKTSRAISWRLRFLVMRRDNFKCCIDGKSPATHPGTILQVDHIKPWSKGGKTVMENLQTLCEQCNIGKSNLSLQKHDQKS